MPDILIIRRREHGYVFPESSVGKQWLRTQVRLFDKEYIVLDWEDVEDLIKHFETEGLVIEIK